MNRLSRLSRIMTLAGALLLGALYVAPLWSIRLLAPQYPEGLGMLIRLNAIDGVKENDLRNINSLNHYIGMRPIEASAIPELRYMPWIVAGLIVTGAVVALLGRRRLLAVWVASFAALGVAGLFDFWRWGYDYGHNLDVENAIITVPGMTYQPPLIGTKQLLNFTASSWPDVGGVLAGIAFLLGFAALVVEIKRRPRARRAANAMLAAATVACTAGPQIIRVGVDLCIECRMLVSDARFGAQLVTRTGKMLTFDSIECMNRYLAALPTADDIKHVWVVDARHPGTLVRLSDATTLSDGKLHPPMGAAYTVATTANAR